MKKISVASNYANDWISQFNQFGDFDSKFVEVLITTSKIKLANNKYYKS